MSIAPESGAGWDLCTAGHVGAQPASAECVSAVSAQVGYTVRFDDVTSDNTKIKFLTDGMLLREAISDSLLRKYSCVILDEAHERTIHTDVLFGVVKAAQRRRKELGKLPLKVGAAGCAAAAGKPRGGRGAGLGARGGRARLPSRYPRPCSVPHAGDCDVGHHGRGPVLSVFQWSPRPLPGGPAAPDPDFLHQAASAGLPARRPGLGLPDPPGRLRVQIPGKVCLILSIQPWKEKLPNETTL